MNRIFETVEKNIDNLAEQEVLWSRCVSDEEMRSAKDGKIDLHLTHTKKLPADWLPSSVKGLKILCLAGAGGQQAPILAMAGAEVTVLDLSEKITCATGWRRAVIIRPATACRTDPMNIPGRKSGSNLAIPWRNIWADWWPRDL